MTKLWSLMAPVQVGATHTVIHLIEMAEAGFRLSAL